VEKGEEGVVTSNVLLRVRQESHRHGSSQNIIILVERTTQLLLGVHGSRPPIPIPETTISNVEEAIMAGGVVLSL
jgi:hypothetical protein